MRPRRENARRQPGIGAKQKTSKRVKDTAFQARKQGKNQPLPGAIGAAFYLALFGAKGGAK